MPSDSRTLILLKNRTTEKKEAVSDTNNSKNYLIKHRIQEENWLKKYFKEGSKMNNLLSRKRLSFFLL